MAVQSVWVHQGSDGAAAYLVPERPQAVESRIVPACCPRRSSPRPARIIPRKALQHLQARAPRRPRARRAPVDSPGARGRPPRPPRPPPAQPAAARPRPPRAPAPRALPHRLPGEATPRVPLRACGRGGGRETKYFCCPPRPFVEKMAAADARATAAGPLRAWQLPAPRPQSLRRARPRRRSGCRAGPRQGPAPRPPSARQRG